MHDVYMHILNSFTSRRLWVSSTGTSTALRGQCRICPTFNPCKVHYIYLYFHLTLDLCLGYPPYAYQWERPLPLNFAQHFWLQRVCVHDYTVTVPAQFLCRTVCWCLISSGYLCVLVGRLTVCKWMLPFEFCRGFLWILWSVIKGIVTL